VGTYTPTDSLDPEQRELLASIARRQVRQSLRAALDAATLLTDLTSRDAEDYAEVLELWAEIGHASATADERLKDR